MRLIDAPVGLLMYDGCLAFKTEYSTVIQAESGEIVTPDCYVVESGEYFWGGAKTAEDRNNLNVEPIELPHALLDNCPTVDLKDLRPHGRWESVKNPRWPAYSHDKCSVCGWWNTRNALCYDGGHKPGHSLNYCPNCGAKMIEEVLNA
ncbi:hypothetical protein [Neobittarella massiliensis]|uniref:hypothetical protein n=1 Tax=Neobittarella massiliensis (ex Bilen et al. 2018) TaxID=2041842 RepID=UPI000CF66749|nr:hypothetical protein [Neobittarella massiliensis]